MQLISPHSCQYPLSTASKYPQGVNSLPSQCLTPAKDTVSSQLRFTPEQDEWHAAVVPSLGDMSTQHNESKHVSHNFHNPKQSLPDEVTTLTRPRKAAIPQIPISASSLPSLQDVHIQIDTSGKSVMDEIDSDDVYTPIQLDMEALDMSKSTLEQLTQIDPRQAQLWMLLKMNEMVKKVEDVYESAGQHYSVNKEPSTLPARSSVPPTEIRPKEYQNITTKRPVPKPRIRVPKTIPTIKTASDALESCRQEGKSTQDTYTGAVKLHRRQKVIGKSNIY